MTANKLISSFEAAKILGFTPDYIRRLCARGIIKADKIAGNWLIKERALYNISRQRRPSQKKDN